MKQIHKNRKNRKDYFRKLLIDIHDFLFSHQLLLVVFVVGAIIAISSSLFFYFEAHAKDTLISKPFDAFWWVVVTLSTVGYGDIFPKTTEGRIIGIFLMFIGVAFMSLLTATIASKIVERDLKGGMGMLDITLEGHVVICGWNHHARKMVEQILESIEKEIVILAELQSKPYEHRRVYFVKGDPTDEMDLHRANISRADTAIVLTDLAVHKMESADARAILTTLAIETINSDVYTCAEILDSKNIPHLRNAKVNEVITSGEFSGRLMARTAITHGISKVITDLLTPDEGNELSKVKIPDQVDGMKFDELFCRLRDKPETMILVAIERNTDVFVNPEKGFVLHKGDQAILICRQKPDPEDLL
ncbi:MAG: ion channel [Firmicutes bacterium]|nr:ion channel [Bacillota bacterium]